MATRCDALREREGERQHDFYLEVIDVSCNGSRTVEGADIIPKLKENLVLAQLVVSTSDLLQLGMIFPSYLFALSRVRACVDARAR